MSQGANFFSYDELQYVGTAYAQTSPDWLATVARLHGMRPAPVDRCRVLEIACGDGNNLLPMAYALPGSTFLGIDLAAGPLVAAREAAARLQMSNVRFEACDLSEFPAGEGQFDYIIAHGIYSWCPPNVREGLMKLCAAHLAPQGIAFISFNAYPGYHHVDLERAAMLFHLGNTEARTPAERVRNGLGMLDFIAKARGEDTPCTRQIAESREAYLKRLQTGNDAITWFNHDLLSEHNTPFYFHRFMAHAEAHGLQFVSHIVPRILPLMNLPEQTCAVLQNLIGNPLVLEQYLDFVVNTRFRQVVLCRAGVALNRTYGPAVLDGLFVSGELSPAPTTDGNTPSAAPNGAETFQGVSGEITVRDAGARDTIQQIGAAGKKGVAFAELAAGLPTGVTVEDMAGLLVRLYVNGMVQLSTYPGIAASRAGQRPEASALARLQAETSSLVVNLSHEKVQLGPFTRQLVLLLDGSRDRAGLLKDLSAWMASGQAASDYAKYPEVDRQPILTPETLEGILDGELTSVAKLGLLLA